MPTKVISTAGTTLSISASLPATYDAAGFQALSYTVVAEVTDVGQYGKQYTLISFNSINDRKTYKFRGSYNNGALALKLGKATLANTDAGQVLLTAAAGSDISYSYRVTNQDGTDDYFTGKMMSLQTTVGGPNNILMLDAQLELDSDVVSTI